jgi:TolB-like protein/Flp pilus assembly protein TadD
MTSKPESEPPVQIAHVLAMDVVAYSTLLITQQTRVMSTLTELVKKTSQFRRSESENKLVRIPTGDGMALVFFDDPQTPLKCAIEISSALKSHPEIRVRMGIHSGPVNQVIDVSERSNVAGAGIDMAQRVMDCGEAGHILLSKRVAEDLAPFPRWNPYLHELGERQVKHGRKIALVNFHNAEIGNPSAPAKTQPQPTSSRRRQVWIVVGLVALLFVIAAVIFKNQQRSRNLATPENPKSIAVLPFENLSQDPDNAYFADGIQEEILSRLSKIGDLKVISRTSTQRYKSAPKNLPEIARQLGVAHILEGTVQKAGDQVRVNVQLIEARTDSHRWADEYDRKLTDVFVVESDIAGKIANALQTKITASERERITASPTGDADAHQLYLRGRYFWSKQTGPDLDKAIDYFNRAVARDPDYAVAYAGLSDCYRVLFFWSANPTHGERAADMQKARAAAEKALAIDDTLGAAHESLAGILYFSEFDLSRAKREFERAVELDPNDATAHAWFAYTVLPALGDMDRALAEIKRAIELDPFSPSFNANLGYLLIMARRYPEAIVQCRKAIELEPTYYLSHQDLAQALELSGHLDEAIAEYEKPHPSSHDPYVLAFRAHVYGIKGDRAKANRLLDEMKALEHDHDVWPFGFALAYLGLANKTEAVNWLERGYDRKEYDMLGMLRLHPMVDPLRGDPRFEQLIARLFPPNG